MDFSDELHGKTLGKRPSVFSAAYWKEAAAVFTDTKMLVFAAMIIALCVAVKLLRIPLAAGLNLTLHSYVVSLGSMIYGPVMGLAVGAISDVIGCIIAPSGAYFAPFTVIEMSSSFIFALFLWKQKISLPRIFAAKFTVNFVCNIIFTSIAMKWMYAAFQMEGTYSLINLTRIVKNLVLFPLESVLIATVIGAAMPALRSLKLTDNRHNLRPQAKHYLLIAGLTFLSVALVVVYVVFLKDFIDANNIKLF